MSEFQQGLADSVLGDLILILLHVGLQVTVEGLCIQAGAPVVHIEVAVLRRVRPVGNRSAVCGSQELGDSQKALGGQFTQSVSTG